MLEQNNSPFDDMNSNNYRSNNYNKGNYESRMNDKELAFKILERKTAMVGKDTKELVRYLDIQSRFEVYSPSNCLLILGKLPNATYFRDMKGWQQDGYIVNTRSPYAIITERKDIVRNDGSVRATYETKRVYDISSTNAPLKEEKALPNQSDVIFALIKSIKSKAVDELEIKDKCASYNAEENIMYVCRNRKHIDIFQDMLYEMAKHNLNKENKNSKEVNSFKATCITYLVCKKFGIDFPTETFTRLENKLSGTTKEIREELASIKDHALMLSNQIEVELKEQAKIKQQKAKGQER